MEKNCQTDTKTERLSKLARKLARDNPARRFAIAKDTTIGAWDESEGRFISVATLSISGGIVGTPNGLPLVDGKPVISDDEWEPLDTTGETTKVRIGLLRGDAGTLNAATLYSVDGRDSAMLFVHGLPVNWSLEEMEASGKHADKLEFLRYVCAAVNQFADLRDSVDALLARLDEVGLSNQSDLKQIVDAVKQARRSGHAGNKD